MFIKPLHLAAWNLQNWKNAAPTPLPKCCCTQRESSVHHSQANIPDNHLPDHHRPDHHLPDHHLNDRQQQLQEAIATNNDHAIGAALDALGVAYSQLQQHERTQHLCTAAATILRDTPHQRAEACALHHAGMAAYHLQDYGEALHLLHRSLALFTTLDDMAAEAVICNSLGQVYEAIGELQTALYYYWDAMTFWKELGDRQGGLYNLVCMAGAYRQEEMPFSALDAYRHAALLWSEIAPGEAIAQVEANYRDDDLEPILNAYQSIFSPVLEQFYLQFQELR